LSKRSGDIARQSRETRLRARVKLDARGRVKVATGVAFLDNLLQPAARYSGVALTLQGTGDVHLDTHHLVEDTGTVLRQAHSTKLG